MKKILLSIGLLALLLLAFAGGKYWPNRPPDEPAFVVPDTIPELTLAWYKYQKWALPSHLGESTYWQSLKLGDRATYVEQHREEMLQTLKVTDVQTVDDIGAAFITYSVGSNVYREVVWVRRVGEVWRVSTRQWFYDGDEVGFHEGHVPEAKQLIEAVDKWKEESPPSFMN